MKGEYWEAFTADMEHDLYGAQRKVWGMLRWRKKEINEYMQSQLISKEEWTSFFRKLYQEEAEEYVQVERNFEANTHIDPNLVAKLARALKNRKEPGPDNIEMIKYGGEELHVQLSKLY